MQILGCAWPFSVTLLVSLSTGVVVEGCTGSNGDGGMNTASGGEPTSSTGGARDTGSTRASAGGSAAASAGSTASSAPTWTGLYDSYLGTGTIGHCVNCHSWATSASGAYDYLQRRGQMDGTSSPPLVTSGESIFKWFGGAMPQDSNPQSAQAVTDFLAWAAAGAQKN